MSCILNDAFWDEINLKMTFELKEASLYLEKKLFDIKECSSISPNCTCAKFDMELEIKFRKYAKCIHEKQQSTIFIQSENALQTERELNAEYFKQLRLISALSLQSGN